MKQHVHSNYETDEHGNPNGGVTYGTGLCVVWQRGPLSNGDTALAEPNGCFVETLLDVALDRLRYYQSLKFNCIENQHAIELIEHAIKQLNARSARLAAEGKEGTHEA